MIDVSSLRAPGWEQLVRELASTPPDDALFLRRLLAVLGQATAARQAALVLPQPGAGGEVEARVVLTWPWGADGSGGAGGGGGGDPSSVLEAPEKVRAAARATFESGHCRAFSLEQTDGPYYQTGAQGGFILAIPVPDGRLATGSAQVDAATHDAPVVDGAGASGDGAGASSGGGVAATGGGGVGAVVTLTIEPRSRDAVRTTLAMAELIAGYAHAHNAKQALRRALSASASLDVATRLIASINAARTFRGAAMQLCNDVSRVFGCDRVAIGWVRHDVLKLAALSDTEHFDRRMAMVQKLESAMEECLDQDQPVVYPAPAEQGPDSDMLLSQAITHAHRELAAGVGTVAAGTGGGGAKVSSFPLRVGDELVGVMTVESGQEKGITLQAVELLQAVMDLISPVLAIRKSDDRSIVVRTFDWSRERASWAVGPKHTVWKVVAVSALALLVFVSLYRMPYRVGAEATIEPSERRLVSAPLDGVIAHVWEGALADSTVEAGQVLAELDTTELRLSANEQRAKLQQARRQAQAARAEGKAFEAEQYELQASQIDAQLRLLDERITRSVIRAPIGGLIVDDGELRQRLGSTIKLGDPMMVIAQMDELVAVVRVDERDITLLREAQARASEEGGAATGWLATRSRPNDRLPLQVLRVVPLATPAEGKNVFEVRATLMLADDADARRWIRPGMEGLARFDTREASLAWIGSRRVLDTIRLWLW